MSLDYRKQPNEWWVAIICGMATFVDTGLTTGISTALVLFQASDVNPDGLTLIQIGSLTAVLTLGIAVGSLLGGRLGDRFGRHKVFIATMGGTALGAALPLLSINFGVMVIGIAIMGIGTGADLPVALATIAEFASDKNRGKLIVFTNLMGGFGIALAVGMAVLYGNRGVFGGKMIFAAFAVVGVVVLLLRFTIPETPAWLEAKRERDAGVRSVRADRVKLSDLLSTNYRKPFLSLVFFYMLVGISVSVMSSFGTFAATNIAHVDVPTWSLATMWAMPIAIGGALGFMAIADTKFRMPAYVVGAALTVFGIFIPVIFGINFASLLSATLLITGSGAFCYETIMKVWTQESFPTMLRSSAQGIIYGISRFAMAALNVVTPSLLAMSAIGLYSTVGALSAIGFLIGWLGFRGVTRNEFHHDAELEA